MVSLNYLAVTAALFASVTGSVIGNRGSYEVESVLEILPQHMADGWRERQGSRFGPINFRNGKNMGMGMSSEEQLTGPVFQPDISTGNAKPTSGMWSRSKTSISWPRSIDGTSNLMERADGQIKALSDESQLQEQIPIGLVAMLSEFPVGLVGRRRRRSTREYKPKWGKGKKTG